MRVKILGGVGRGVGGGQASVCRQKCFLRVDLCCIEGFFCQILASRQLKAHPAMSCLSLWGGLRRFLGDSLL